MPSHYKEDIQALPVEGKDPIRYRPEQPDTTSFTNFDYDDLRDPTLLEGIMIGLRQFDKSYDMLAIEKEGILKEGPDMPSNTLLTPEQAKEEFGLDIKNPITRYQAMAIVMLEEKRRESGGELLDIMKGSLKHPLSSLAALVGMMAGAWAAPTAQLFERGIGASIGFLAGPVGGALGYMAPPVIDMARKLYKINLAQKVAKGARLNRLKKQGEILKKKLEIFERSRFAKGVAISGAANALEEIAIAQEQQTRGFNVNAAEAAVFGVFAPAVFAGTLRALGLGVRKTAKVAEKGIKKVEEAVTPKAIKEKVKSAQKTLEAEQKATETVKPLEKRIRKLRKGLKPEDTEKIEEISKLKAKIEEIRPKELEEVKEVREATTVKSITATGKANETIQRTSEDLNKAAVFEMDKLERTSKPKERWDLALQDLTISPRAITNFGKYVKWLDKMKNRYPEIIDIPVEIKALRLLQDTVANEVVSDMQTLFYQLQKIGLQGDLRKVYPFLSNYDRFLEEFTAFMKNKYPNASFAKQDTNRALKAFFRFDWEIKAREALKKKQPVTKSKDRAKVRQLIKEIQEVIKGSESAVEARARLQENGELFQRASNLFPALRKMDYFENAWKQFMALRYKGHIDTDNLKGYDVFMAANKNDLDEFFHVNPGTATRNGGISEIKPNKTMDIDPNPPKEITVEERIKEIESKMMETGKVGEISTFAKETDTALNKFITCMTSVGGPDVE